MTPATRPVDRRAAADLRQQLACDAGADAFRWAARSTGTVGAEPGSADEVGEQGECDAGHPGRDLAVIEVGGERDSPDPRGYLAAARRERAKRPRASRDRQAGDALSGGDKVPGQSPPVRSA